MIPHLGEMTSSINILYVYYIVHQKYFNKRNFIPDTICFMLPIKDCLNYSEMT